MNKRQKITVGSIFKIDLNDSYHTYGRILNNANYAFYDFNTKEDINNLEKIISQPILFIIAVYNYAINKGLWIKIGTIPLEKSLLELPMKFIQDSMDAEKFSLYNPNTGEITPATRNECKGLERAAVWEAEQVESRIRDYYAGRPNYWLEQMKIK